MSYIALLIGLLFTIAIYLILSTQYIRWLYGLILFTSIINMIILLVGRVYFTQPSFIGQASINTMSNPLSEALVLTAIVISFAFIVFVLILLRTLHAQTNQLHDEFKNPPSLMADQEKRSHE